jgi:signal peptidase II
MTAPEDAQVSGSLPPPGPVGPIDFAEPPIVGERLGVPSGAAMTILDPHSPRPRYPFLFVVSTLALASDVSTKLWAEKRLEPYPGFIELVPNHLQLILARNKGGAWGLLQSTSENVRRPFFLLVSAAAIIFIMTLFRRLQPGQRALKWGLPLVLGGALGNVFDRVRYGHVIDFIDYRAEWVRAMNDFFVKVKVAQISTDHWPTFNVADVWICVGVGLMAIDMLTAKRVRTGRTIPPPPPSVPPPPEFPRSPADAPPSPPAGGENAAS